MKKNTSNTQLSKSDEHMPHIVRLPGFITDEQVGLGDVIKRMTSYVGIKPCGGCEQRVAALNQWMRFIR